MTKNEKLNRDGKIQSQLYEVLKVYTLHGLVAQLVRAPPCHGGGHGFESRLGRFIWDLSSAGRASALQAEGHRFEPCRSHLKLINSIIQYADVAQLAEQLICNQQVIGSSPIIGFYGWIPEWPKGADCKSVGFAFEGSNPSPSI